MPESRHPDKKGHSCCGACCDMRRAVIIVNTISVILTVIGIILIAANVQGPNGGDNPEDLEFTTAIIVSTACGLTFAALAIVGAVLFNKWLVGLNILWLIASLALSIVGIIAQVNDEEEDEDEDTTGPSPTVVAIINGVVTVLFTLLFIYPHAYFVKENHQGILTKETYEIEEQSCCCVEHYVE